MARIMDSHILLRAFVDELARCGMRHAVTSPGSRNSPLLLALAREERIRAWSHIDERSGGFFALGLAKATGTPTAVTVTSGTAAANLAPAVVEAWQARVPLLVLTADRPPELREVGAGQAIDQLRLYGSAAKWFFEVGNHEATPDRMRWIRMLACRAYWTSLDGRAGPVHLNFPLREPLVPGGEIPPEPGEGGRAGERPWLTRPRTAARPTDAVVGQLMQEIADRPNGVIVAGRDERHPELSASVARFANAVGYPLLADPLSGARAGDAAVAHYDHLLRSQRFASTHTPEMVIRIGDLPTSKPLRAWLAANGAAVQIGFDTEGTWQDPDSVVSTLLAADATATLDAIRDGVSKKILRRERGWLHDWQAADRTASARIAGTLGVMGGLSEPRIAAELGVRLPSYATLFVASSMPVRDVESFFPVRPTQPRVLSNRGANGIDGTISSALGAAAAGGGPVVCLIGDVALLHDLGGLLASDRLGLNLVVVLINNDGGGIFHFLPIAGEEDAFEEHVATPHGVHTGRLAALFGMEHDPVVDPPAFRAALDRALMAEGSTLIEVRTDRAENLDLHRRVAAAVTEALGG
jgi:2-succinyl-5-enolpyruvyl-6-hydroxy-3-cyclohexene-1-carboxylate synthase